MPKTLTIEGREIFSAGIWNGDKYTDQDLRDIESSFSELGFKVPLKVGHDTKSGEQAYGVIENVKKIGNKLFADFTNLSEEIYNAIKDKKFLSVSSEIFWNLKRNGKIFRRALSGVALLGSKIPAVDLTPVYDGVSDFSQGANLDYEIIKTCNKKMSDDDKNLQQTDLAALTEENKQYKIDLAKLTGDLAELKMTKTDNSPDLKMNTELENTKRELALIQAERKQEKLTQKLESVTIPTYRELLKPIVENVLGETKMVKFSQGGKTEDVTLEVVLDKFIDKLNDDSKWLLKEFSTLDTARPEHVPDTQQAASTKVDELTQVKMAKDKMIYADALNAVLLENKELAKTYMS